MLYREIGKIVSTIPALIYFPIERQLAQTIVPVIYLHTSRKKIKIRSCYFL